jgi:hypothetical protein
VHLVSKHKVLSSNPSTATKKKKKKRTSSISKEGNPKSFTDSDSVYAFLLLVQSDPRQVRLKS